MNEDDIRQSIVTLLAEENRAPLAANEMAAALKLEGRAKKHLSKTLHQLVVDGDIVVIRGNRYSLGEPADLVTGDIQIVRSGNGFVTDRAGRRTVFVPAADIGTALPGDRVVARIDRDKPSARGRMEGRVIRILERKRRDIVGTLKTTGTFFYVVPIDSSYAKDFYVPDAAGAAIGDRVVVRFGQWANRHVNPEGEIVEIIGPADRPESDTLSVIRHYGLHDEFPPETLREAEVASIRLEDAGRREDLREVLTITIDPERARDFDDALSLHTREDGVRVLGVHIADVSRFVTPGSALDAEAALRGNSVYLPDKVLPMLPEQLSNGVCSLNPRQDKLTFSAFITFDGQAAPVESRFSRTVIRSRARLTYEQAMDVLAGRSVRKRAAREGAEGVTDEVAALVRALGKLAQQIRRRRFARHALALDVPECEVVLDADGRMTGLRPVVNDESHQLVEECMVAANEAVARALSEASIPFISRLHEPPDELKIEDLTTELVSLGYEPGDLSKPKNLSAFLRKVEGDPLEYHVRTAVLRSMKRAVYSADESGHFGLAKRFYAHFTSPIRRYADLTVHRQLAALLERARPPYTLQALRAPAWNCSETESQAERAERDVLEMKKYRYLSMLVEEQRAETFQAVVVKVTNFGMFIDIPDLQLGGLVHVSALSDRFVRFDRAKQTLSAGKTVFKLGHRLSVRPVGVDFENRRIDFVPV